MNSEDIEKLLAAWQEASWTYRVTGFGLGDIGIDYRLEAQIIDGSLPALRAALERDDPYVKIEIYQQLKSQGMLTEEFASLLTLEAPATEDLLYKPDDFHASCILLAPDFSRIDAELMEYFSRNPAALHELTPRKFEELLDAVFSNQGYKTKLGPGRGDGGVDLRLVSKDSVGEVMTLVQAKLYAPNRPISLEAVAALYGVVESERANRGLFVTTPRYLPSAKRFADTNHHRLVLATADDVAQWCGQGANRKYFLEALNPAATADRKAPLSGR